MPKEHQQKKRSRGSPRSNKNSKALASAVPSKLKAWQGLSDNIKQDVEKLIDNIMKIKSKHKETSIGIKCVDARQEGSSTAAAKEILKAINETAETIRKKAVVCGPKDSGGVSAIFRELPSLSQLSM